MTLLVFVPVRNNNLRSRLSYSKCVCQTNSMMSCRCLSEQGVETKIRTELGNEISSEETRAAKHGRNVPRYCTTPRRTIRDNWRAIRQGVYSALELRKKMWQSVALANTAGEVGIEKLTLPVGAATRGSRAIVAEERSMSRQGE
jgi:hypothetical protein